jgi:methyl-accepting chemotaxis protein
MRLIANLTIGRKLALLIATAIAVSIVVAVAGERALETNRTAADLSDSIHDGMLALRELDTRNSELKVDAYRSLLVNGEEQASAQLLDDIADDRATVEEISGRLAEAGLEPALAQEGAAVAGASAEFGAFVDQYARLAIRDEDGAKARIGELQERNSVADDQVGASLERFQKSSDTAIAAADRAAAQSRALVILMLVLGIAVLTAIAFAVTRGILGPVRAVGTAARSLAEGDVTSTIEVSSGDEVGRMARELNVAMERLRSTLTSIGSSAELLSGSSEELTKVSSQMGSSAGEANAQAGVVRAAAEEVSRNVETVAAGTEQMGTSVTEIARSAADAARTATGAVQLAQESSATVAKLGESSNEIAGVIKVITSIAEQTNLLALNATIEAARAGEAGKGFAVVAGEVKELAQETAKATEDIGRRIETIQADTAAAITAIDQISTVIDEINQSQSTIASAVEQQSATTTEISRSIADAANGTGEIARNIASVADAASSASEGVDDTQRAADDLARMAGELRQLVGQFRY